MIKEKKLLVEVKSINTVIGEQLTEYTYSINLKNELGWLQKINLTIHEIEKKEKGEYEEFSSLGVIYIDPVQFQLSKAKELLYNIEFINISCFSISKLDGLLIYPAQVGGGGENKEPILYTKSKQISKFLKSS